MFVQEKETTHKKVYEAPQIYRIIITPDELAATACKSTMQGRYICRKGSIFVNRDRGS